MMPASGTPAARLLALSLLAAILALPVWLAAGPVTDAYRIAVAELRGADAALARIAADRGAAPADPALLLPPGPASAAAASLQRRVQAAAAAAGGAMESVEPLPAESVDGVRRVTLRVQMRLDTPGLRAVLHSLEYGAPMVLIDNVAIRALSGRAVGADRPLSVRFDMTALQPENG